MFTSNTGTTVQSYVEVDSLSSAAIFNPVFFEKFDGLFLVVTLANNNSIDDFKFSVGISASSLSGLKSRSNQGQNKLTIRSS